MSAKVSIIIPAFNAAKSIKTTINSILNQDFTDYEILVINDGSTDNTLQICESLNNPKVKVYTKENGGLVSSYSYGITKTTTDYIMFCDADDTFKPDALSKTYNYITETNVDFCAFGYDICTENEEPYRTVLNGFSDGVYTKDDYETKVFPSAIFNTKFSKKYYSITIPRWCKIYRTDLLKKIQPYLNEKCHQIEDNICTTLCLLHSNSFATKNESIYNYIVSKNTMSTAFNWDLIKYYEYSFSHLKSILSNFSIPDCEEQLKYMRFDFYRVIFRRASKQSTYKDVKKLLKIIRNEKITKSLKLKKITVLKNKLFYILEKLRFDYLNYLIYKKA